MSGSYPKGSVVIIHRKFSPPHFTESERGPLAWIEKKPVVWSEVMKIAQAAANGVATEADKRNPWDVRVPGCTAGARVVVIGFTEVKREWIENALSSRDAEDTQERLTWITSTERNFPRQLEEVRSADIVIVWQPLKFWTGLDLKTAALACIIKLGLDDRVFTEREQEDFFAAEHLAPAPAPPIELPAESAEEPRPFRSITFDVGEIDGQAAYLPHEGFNRRAIEHADSLSYCKELALHLVDEIEEFRARLRRAGLNDDPRFVLTTEVAAKGLEVEDPAEASDSLIVPLNAS
jgi:hypothetical protein